MRLHFDPSGFSTGEFSQWPARPASGLSSSRGGSQCPGGTTGAPPAAFPYGRARLTLGRHSGFPVNIAVMTQMTTLWSTFT